MYQDVADMFSQEVREHISDRTMNSALTAMSEARLSPDQQQIVAHAISQSVLEGLVAWTECFYEAAESPPGGFKQ